MKILTATATALATTALAVLAPALPASAVMFDSAERSAQLARSLGARRAVFYLENGHVIAEDWLLSTQGWPKKKVHEAIRRIAGTQGAFAKREVKGGNEWLTPRAGITAVLAEGATSEAFTISRTDFSYEPKAHVVMVYLPGLRLIRQAPTPENVALIKAGMDIDTAAAILGPWDAPKEDRHDHDDGAQPPMTWNRNGKPVVRLHLKDAKVARVQKL